MPCKCCCKESSSAPSSNFRCCSNLRAVLYGIWLHRKHSVILTIIQIALPIAILLSSNCIHESLLPKFKHISDWTILPVQTESQILEKIICPEKCDHNPWIVFHPETEFTRNLVNLSLKYFYGSTAADLTKSHFVKQFSEFEDYGLLSNLVGKKSYLMGGVQFHDVTDLPKVSVPKTLKMTVHLATYIPFRKQSISSFSHERNDPKHYMHLMGIQLALSKAFEELITLKKLNGELQNDVETDVSVKGRSGKLKYLRNQLLNSSFSLTTAIPISSPSSNTTHNNLTTFPSVSTSKRKPTNFTISIRPFPYPPHIEYMKTGETGDNIEWVIPTAIVLGFTIVILTFTGAPVSHKESGFKLELHMMGMPSSFFWGGWIFNQLLVQLITISLQTYLLFTPICSVVLVTRGSYSLWFFVLFAFNLASLSFMAFISAFFKRSIMCTYVGATIWLLSFYFVNIYWPTDTSFWFRFLSCIIPNAALVWAVTLLTSLGGEWDTLNLSMSEEGISLVYVIAAFFVDALLYFLLIPYVDHIRPGPFEVIQPWNYFYEGWVCRRACEKEDKTRIPQDLESTTATSTSRNSLSSRSSRSSKSKSRLTFVDTEVRFPSVEFVGLTKKYRRVKDVYAVDNVNFKIYPGKITVLLGHNGSGKTTLLRLLCGEYYPSKGTAYVQGLDIRHHRNAVTHLMSVCFQRNLLSNDMTTKEHLILIGILKGLGLGGSRKRAQELLEQFDLTHVRNSRMDKLLEHEKRVLSVALALVGKSPVIVMDDVTTGLETDVKRLIWDTLKAIKGAGSTIIVFTADMEEAYYLGDRIAIVSKGKIVGSGSAKRLERLFGTGYHLRILMESGRDKTPVLNFVKQCIESTEEVESRPARLNKAMELVNQDEEEEFEQPALPSEERLDDRTTLMDFLSLGFKHEPKPTPPPIPTIQPVITLLTPPEFNASRKPSNMIVLSDPGAFRMDPMHINEPAEPVEVVLLLPKNESPYFQNLFDYLEENSVKKSLGIINYRLKLYSMKQAFDEVDEYMQLDDIKHKEGDPSRPSFASNPDKLERSKRADSTTSSSELTAVVHSACQLSSNPLPMVPDGTSRGFKCCRVLQRLRGLIMKRLLWIKGGWLYALVQVVVPILLLLFLMQATRDYYLPSVQISTLHYKFHSVFPKAAVPYVKSTEESPQENKLFNYFTAQLGGVKPVKLDLSLDDLTAFYKFLSGLDPKNSKQNKKWNSTSLSALLYDKVVVGADLRDPANPVGYFSSAAYHAPPLTLLALINTRLAVVFPGEEYSIEVSSRPTVYRKQILDLLNFAFTDSEYFSKFEQCFILAIIMGYGFFVFTSGFTSQPTAERLNMLKRLQLNTGVSSFSYWFSLFIVDFTLSMALAGILLILLWNFPRHNTFANYEFAKYYFLHWGLASYTSIHYSYIFSFYFRRGTTSYFAMLSINQVLGLFMFTLAVTLKESSAYIAGPVSFALHFLHPFTVPAGLYSLANVAVRNNLCWLMSPVLSSNICARQGLSSALDAKLRLKFQQTCCMKNFRPCVESGKCILIQPYIDFQSLFHRWGNLDNCTLSFLFLILHAIVATFALYVIERKVDLRRLCCRKKAAAKEAEEVRRLSIVGDERLMAKYEKAESVRQEKVDVETVLRQGLGGAMSEFVVYEVTLRHRNRQLLTDISLVAEPGGLCCIVGPSGSGKTTLFRILANETFASEGNVYYSGVSLAHPLNINFLSQIGFCPPAKDFILSRVSGIQVLRLVGRLRGIPESQLQEHVHFWLKELGLLHEASGHCEYFSDSAKQRLALACCFIGDPKIIIMDDPLPHLDPENRLHLWTLLDKILCQDRIVIMTTSSMENVQRHCNKICFLVNGALRHITTPQKLVEEFGLGTTLTYVVYLRPETEQDSSANAFELYTELKARIERDIPNVVLQEELHFCLRYNIDRCQMELSDLFGLVDAISVDFVNVVKEYELRETSMQDVYASFAMKQNKYRIYPSTLDTFCLSYC